MKVEKRRKRLERQQHKEDLRLLIIIIVALVIICSLGNWLWQRHENNVREAQIEQQQTKPKVKHQTKAHKQHATKQNDKVNATWLTLKRKQKMALIIQAYNHDEQDALNVNDLYWALKGNLTKGTIYHNGNSDGFQFQIKRNRLVITDSANRHFTHSLTWLVKRYYQDLDAQQFSNKLAKRIMSLTNLRNYVKQQNELAAQQASIAAANAAAQKAAAASAAAKSSAATNNSNNNRPAMNNNQHYSYNTNNSYVHYQPTNQWHAQ